MAGLLEHTTSTDPGDLSGRPVVTFGGDDVAAIHEPLPEDDEQAGFSLAKRTLFGGMLPWTLPAGSVHAVGPDAVVIADATVLTRAHDDEDDSEPDLGPALRTGPGDRDPSPATSPVLLSEARGRAVVAVDTGETIGRVDRVVVDPVTATIASLRLDNTTSSGRFVSWNQLVAFGDETVEAPTASCLRPPDGPREDGCRSTFRTRGKTVLGDDGTVLGELADLEFDRDDARVTALVLEGGDRVDGGRLRGLGPHAIVVRA